MARIELSKSAFFHNLALLSNKLGNKEKIAIVLKDNAYGHGLLPMAKLSQEFGLTRTVVRTFDEAKVIENYFKHILILTPKAPFAKNPKYTLAINHLSELNTIPPQSQIELKIDTGMHRNGIGTEEIKEAFALILKHKHHLKGVMTHFRSADELGSELFWQRQKWEESKELIKDLCQKYALAIPLFHSANSAATLRLESYEEDFARCGIAAYGYHEMHPLFGNFDLKPVLSLYAQKIASRELKRGERVGYGGLFCAKKRISATTYDIGYGDGFFRYNGKGELRINGYKILGRISMDSLTLEGNEEEVCLIGDAKEIAHAFDTISYEILVKLNPQIPRLIVH